MLAQNSVALPICMTNYIRQVNLKPPNSYFSLSGPGIDDSANRSNDGLGFALIKHMVRQLQAEHKYQLGDGFNFQM